MIDWLNRHQTPLALAVLLAVATGLLVSRLTEDSPPPIEFVLDSGAEDGTPIKVQVAGEVEMPGVIDVLAGQRVVDALEAAGGATADADLEALNLACRLRDEERIIVSARPGSAVTAPSLANPVDINSASMEELDALPGIGEAYSRRIVDSRLVDGPFQSADELVERGVIPSATLEGIRALIVAGP